MAGIGSFYNAQGVLVGQAMGMIAAADVALPADTITPFEEVTWLFTKVQLGTPSAGTWTLTLTGGPLAAPIALVAITYNVTNVALAALIQAQLPAGYTAVVTGTGAIATPFIITVTGPGSGKIVITGSGAGLTSGTFLVTPPPWSPLGATEQGWQMNYGVSTQDINIEEQPTPVGRQLTSATFEFTANLSEDVVENLQYALNATKTIQAPDVTHYGKTSLRLQASALPIYAVALEVKNRFTMPRRYYVPEMTCATNVGQTFARARGQRLIPVTFSSVCAAELILVDEITSNHS